MAGAINATEVLDVRELDAMSGGFFRLPLVAIKVQEITRGGTGDQGGQNDAAQMFQQIMQQLTQGG